MRNLGLMWRINTGTGRLVIIVSLGLLAVVGAGVVAGAADGDPGMGSASFFDHVVLDTAAEELVYRGVLALLAGACWSQRPSMSAAT